MKMPSFRPWAKWAILKWLLGSVVVTWAITSTVYAIRLQPKLVLIGLDENGTRLITSQDDPLLESERLKFVREFLFYFYNFNSETYKAQISHAGSFMIDALWDAKKPEFQRIEEQMKAERITQEARLLDLRVVSATEYEADLGILIRHRLVDKSVKYRIGLKLAPRKRDTSNPYAWEVSTLNETEI